MSQGPAPYLDFLRRGPAGSRTWLAMYSTPAVECVRLLVVMQFGKSKRDRRRYDQRLYGALPLSYGPAMESSWAGGTRTHDTRLLKHVLRIGSRSCAIVISVSSSKTSANVSTPRGHCPDQAGRVGSGECRRFWCRLSVAWCKRTAGRRRRL